MHQIHSVNRHKQYCNEDDGNCASDSSIGKSSHAENDRIVNSLAQACVRVAVRGGFQRFGIALAAFVATFAMLFALTLGSYDPFAQQAQAAQPQVPMQISQGTVVVKHGDTTVTTLAYPNIPYRFVTKNIKNTQAKDSGNGHVNGYPGYDKPTLPAAPASASPDSAEAVCAGRKLLYQEHVDAPYATFMQGKLAVSVVDGQQVIEPSQACIRLAPDSVSENVTSSGGELIAAKGANLSRFIVPSDPAMAKLYSFIGKPGTRVWYAPQLISSQLNWNPVWVGIGAFDGEHEWALPVLSNNPERNNVRFELMNPQELPGAVTIFESNASVSEPKISLDTAHGVTSFEHAVGSHGHYNWTFAKSGVYRMKWRLSAQVDNGVTPQQTLQSEVAEVVWLVGTDAELGLPEGTTKGLTDPMPKDEGDGVDASSGNGETPQQDPQLDSQVDPQQDPDGSEGDDPTETDDIDPHTTEDSTGDNAGDSGKRHGVTVATTLHCADDTPSDTLKAQVSPLPKPAANAWQRDKQGHDIEQPITSGHLDLALHDGGVTLDPELGDSYASGTAVVVAPERTYRSVASDIAKILGVNKAYFLPISQDMTLPWQGFSTTEYSNPRELVTMSLAAFDGPGRMIGAKTGIMGTELIFDTAKPAKTWQYQNSHDHMSYFFTNPGVYTVTYRYQLQQSGKAFEYTLRYRVGDVSGQKGSVASAADTTAGAGKASGAASLQSLARGKLLPACQPTGSHSRLIKRTLGSVTTSNPVGGVRGGAQSGVQSGALQQQLQGAQLVNNLGSQAMNGKAGGASGANGAQGVSGSAGSTTTNHLNNGTGKTSNTAYLGAGGSGTTGAAGSRATSGALSPSSSSAHLQTSQSRLAATGSQVITAAIALVLLCCVGSVIAIMKSAA